MPITTATGVTHTYVSLDHSERSRPFDPKKSPQIEAQLSRIVARIAAVVDNRGGLTPSPDRGSRGIRDAQIARKKDCLDAMREDRSLTNEALAERFGFHHETIAAFRRKMFPKPITISIKSRYRELMADRPDVDATEASTILGCSIKTIHMYRLELTGPAWRRK